MALQRIARLTWLLVFVFAGLGRATADEPAVANFSVIHISDIHVDPHLARSGEPGPLRSGETIRWVCEQAAQPQEVAPYHLTAPPPACVLATGDLTEYGMIDDTWAIFERAFHDLPCPLYVVPGNHDNTWVAMYQIMRKRYGGENHSFDKSGCHFVCLCSASPQEPVPSLDAKTRAWLKADLDRTPAGTPIFVALHHPPYSEEFANPAEMETFIDLLRDYNVVLLLYGHGHQVDQRDVGGIPGIMGGSTFGKLAGYGLLSVQDGKVRYAYRYQHGGPDAKDQADAGPTWKGLYEAPLPRAARPRLFEIEEPRAGLTIGGEKLAVKLAARATADATAPAEVAFRIDGKDVQAAAPGGEVLAAELPLKEVAAGAHLLCVTMKLPNKTTDTRTRVFYVDRPGTAVAWRKQLPAAVKAGPVLAGELLIVARNDGVVSALDRHDGAEQWVFSTGGEILGTPACSDGTLVFGSGDGKVYALDGRGGSPRWTFEAGPAVYGSPLVADGTVFIGDNGGRLHALNLADGKPRWTFDRADYSIEDQPAVWQDMVVFGAWDGYVYAVARSDGQLRWKSYGPKSSETKGNRYFAPADCGPVVIDDTLFVCDRGYMLGSYSPAGELRSKWSSNAAALAPAADRRAFYVRSTEDRVSKRDPKADAMWETAVPAGRFPIPPTVGHGRVWLCSNRGRLSVLDEKDGHEVWSYQATPGFYVMAPVAVDGEAPGDAGPACYIAGMDGSLTAVRQR
jgi:outer membrane protein assembly factor BamB/3',5'-cyclic AMP phosphodiesterase CpdA